MWEKPRTYLQVWETSRNADILAWFRSAKKPEQDSETDLMEIARMDEHPNTGHPRQDSGHPRQACKRRSFIRPPLIPNIDYRFPFDSLTTNLYSDTNSWTMDKWIIININSENLDSAIVLSAMHTGWGASCNQETLQSHLELQCTRGGWGASCNQETLQSHLEFQ